MKTEPLTALLHSFSQAGRLLERPPERSFSPSPHALSLPALGRISYFATVDCMREAGNTKHSIAFVAQLIKESTYNAGDLGSIPGLGRSSGEGKGYRLRILAWRITWTV